MSKVILITGASSGIGAAAAQHFHEAGHTVYGTARRVERMAKLAAIGVHVRAMDVTKDEQMTTVIKEILAKEGTIDVLVNNAGYGSYGSLEETPMTEATYQFDVNLFGLARLIQLCLPTMRKAGSGRIINVSSIGGSIGEPFGSWYHATKYAVEGLSDSLRMELRGTSIEVVLIKPGAVKTEWNHIARKNLIKVSGSGPYAESVQRHARMLAKADEQGAAPEVVAKAIFSAATARNPKTRYVVGSGAKPLLFLHHWLPDRWFDGLMATMEKQLGKEA